MTGFITTTTVITLLREIKEGEKGPNTAQFWLTVALGIDPGLSVPWA